MVSWPRQHHRALLGDHADAGVAHPRAGQHHPLDEVQRALHDVALDRAELGGVREQQRVTGEPGRLLGALDDLAVERVRDVGDHECDGTGAAPGRAGDGGGAVAQPLGGREDRPGRLRVDPPGAGVGAGHRRGRDAGRAGDVVDRRAGAHRVTIGAAVTAWQRTADRRRPARQGWTDHPPYRSSRLRHRTHDRRLVDRRGGRGVGAPCAAPAGRAVADDRRLRHR